MDMGTTGFWRSLWTSCIRASVFCCDRSAAETVHSSSNEVIVVDGEKEKHQGKNNVELSFCLHFATRKKGRQENSRECQVSQNL